VCHCGSDRYFLAGHVGTDQGMILCKSEVRMNFTFGFLCISQIIDFDSCLFFQGSTLVLRIMVAVRISVL
jgi:hypothetical protein